MGGNGAGENEAVARGGGDRGGEVREGTSSLELLLLVVVVVMVRWRLRSWVVVVVVREDAARRACSSDCDVWLSHTCQMLLKETISSVELKATYAVFLFVVAVIALPEAVRQDSVERLGERRALRVGDDILPVHTHDAEPSQPSTCDHRTRERRA